MFLQQLSRINLNLLVCLQALMEEQSVSKAAVRLNLSQSAVSKNMAQLRKLLGDPLFTRTSHGLQPTYFSLQMKPELTKVLDQLWHLVQPPAFDPITCDREFRIAFPETAGQMFIPRLMPQLLKEAPNVRLSLHALKLDNVEKLANGELEIALVPHDLDLGQERVAGLHRSELYRGELVCLLREDHPALEKDWTLKAYLNQSHINIGSLHVGPLVVTNKLKQSGLKRKVSVAVDDFLTATVVCESTDLIFTTSRSWAEYACKRHRVVCRPVPIAIEPVVYHLYWHQRSHFDGAHQWLRELIKRSVVIPEPGQTSLLDGAPNARLEGGG